MPRPDVVGDFEFLPASADACAPQRRVSVCRRLRDLSHQSGEAPLLPPLDVPSRRPRQACRGSSRLSGARLAGARRDRGRVAAVAIVADDICERAAGDSRAQRRGRAQTAGGGGRQQGKGMGALRVGSDASGRAGAVDGKPRGITPLTLTDLSAGSHESSCRVTPAGDPHGDRLANATAALDEAIFSGFVTVYSPSS